MTTLASPLARAVDFDELINRGQAPREFVYKTPKDGPDLKLYVFPPVIPPGSESPTAAPAIVWIHGGAWRAGQANAFFPHARYFATRGAVGVSIEYRLMKPQDDSPRLPDLISDCKSAIRYLRAHAAELGIDPDKIVVAGDSAGGHLAAALVTLQGFDDPKDDTKVSAFPNAAVLCNPIVDLTEGGWINYAIGGPAIASTAKPAPTPEQLKDAKTVSPLFSIRPGLPPTFLLHGTDDKVVLPAQSQRFNDAMQAAGNKSQIRLLDGARHAFVVTQYTAPEPKVVEVMREIDKWITSLGYLTGQPTLVTSPAPAWVPKGQMLKPRQTPAASPK